MTCYSCYLLVNLIQQDGEELCQILLAKPKISPTIHTGNLLSQAASSIRDVGAGPEDGRDIITDGKLLLRRVLSPILLLGEVSPAIRETIHQLQGGIDKTNIILRSWSLAFHIRKVTKP